MLRQVITAHEFLLAHAADELLLAGVGAFVAGKLVGAGEALVAVLPLADEWSFAGVNALVSLQVAGLEVVFATVWVLALVDASSFRHRCRSGHCRCLWLGWGRGLQILQNTTRRIEEKQMSGDESGLIVMCWCCACCGNVYAFRRNNLIL